MPVFSASVVSRWHGTRGVDHGTSEFQKASRSQSTSLIGVMTAFVTATSVALRVAMLVLVLIAALAVTVAMATAFYL